MIRMLQAVIFRTSHAKSCIGLNYTHSLSSIYSIQGVLPRGARCIVHYLPVQKEVGGLQYVGKCAARSDRQGRR